MKKIKLVFVNTYIKYNTVTREKTLMFNYAVVGGDSKQYISDKEDEGFYTVITQEEGRDIIPAELIGLPRFTASQELSGLEVERTKKSNGEFGWYVDDLDMIVLESNAKNQPKFVREAMATEMAIKLIADSKTQAAEMRVLKAKRALAAAALEGTANFNL